MNFSVQYILLGLEIKIKVGDAVLHRRYIDVIFSLVLMPSNMCYSHTCISFNVSAKHALVVSLKGTFRAMSSVEQAIKQ